MKAITCPVILTSASTRADGSIGLRLATPELKPDEKAAFFELLNIQCLMLIEPTNENLDLKKDIKGEFDNKSPGQRLRNTLFVLWKQRNQPGHFDDWYRKQMEIILDWIKSKLDPV